MNNKPKRPEKSDPPVKDPHPSDGLTELVVWAVPPVNTRLLICHAADHDGNNPMLLVSVQVRDNFNFVKKMRVRARLIVGNRYSLEGPCPRYRGKW